MGIHVLKFLREYRNYHTLPGDISFISQLLDQKKLFIEQPDKFKVSMSQNSLDYKKLPDNVISSFFSDNQNDIKLFNINSKVLHVAEWLVLSSLSIGLRKLKLANDLREKALERALGYANSKNPFDWLRIDQIIGALIEKEHFKKLNGYLHIARVLRTACGRSKFGNKLNAVINDSSLEYNAVDLAFKEYVSNRSIAIVGPLNLSDSEKEEVKGKDVVITLNDLSLFNGRAYPDIKPDVIYYLRDFQEFFVDKSNESDFQYIPKFLVYNLDKDYSPYLKNRTRVRDDLNPYTFAGSLNFIPRVILDVLLHGGRDLKVYGTDLYTSLDFSSDYDGSRKDNWDEVLKQFIVHDPITNYKFMHSFWTKGFYKADDQLEKVMHMGLDGYLDYFEEKSLARSE